MRSAPSRAHERCREAAVRRTAAIGGVVMCHAETLVGFTATAMSSDGSFHRRCVSIDGRFIDGGVTVAAISIDGKVHRRMRNGHAVGVGPSRDRRAPAKWPRGRRGSIPRSAKWPRGRRGSIPRSTAKERRAVGSLRFPRRPRLPVTRNWFVPLRLARGDRARTGRGVAPDSFPGAKRKSVCPLAVGKGRQSADRTRCGA